MSSAIVRPIRSLAGRNPEQRRLVSEATMTVAIVRVALSLVPFSLMRRGRNVVVRAASRFAKRTRDPQELAAAVRVASRHVPGATCLTQAIALHIMLHRRGIESRIVVGVAEREGRFAAHAWIDHDGVVLIGGDVAPYQPLHRAGERGS